MRVFLTGATGYVGASVARCLQQSGHTLLGLARSPAAAEKLTAGGVQPVEGDLRDISSLLRAMAGADAVIHAAMAWGPDTAQLDRETVLAVIDGLKGSNRAFIYTSGVWVVGDTKGRVVGELAVLRPPALVAWRPAVEKLVSEAAEKRVSGIVIRPAMVYGRGGGTVGGFVRQARQDKVVRMVGNGENHWSFVHVDALADLYVRAVEHPPGGEILFAADGPAFTVRTVVDTVAAMNEATVEVVSVEDARKQMGPIADALVLDQKIMSTKAGRILGWGPKMPSVLEEIRTGSYTH